MKDMRRPSSSAGVARSPATAQASQHLETLSLLICVAEDCFEKAYAAAPQIAGSMSASEVEEHHRLIATGLGCLDVALTSNKIWPRLEARLCLRYASILIEETTNIMAAETTLTRGIAVCEKVHAIIRPPARILRAMPLIRDAASLYRPQIQLAVPPDQDPLPTQSEGGPQITRRPYRRLYNVRRLTHFTVEVD